jgi:1-phosphofructokinase family hexose kinase
MLTAVTLNAALDKTYRVDRLAFGKSHRVTEMFAVPGGKGINVAKVAHAFGARVVASGFAGGNNGDFIERALTGMGIAHEFVRFDGNTRETVTVFDDAGAVMEFLEPGPFVDGQSLRELEETLARLAARSRFVTFSGSAARGLPADVYARLIRVAKARGALTLLDTSGELLIRGLDGQPDLCKPNREELEQAAGRPLTSLGDVVRAARELAGRGIRWVVVSLDREGSVAVSRRAAWLVEAPRIDAVNTVGCGDALVAGLVCGLDRAGSIEDEGAMAEALRLGTAAAASNAMHRFAGTVRPEEVERLLPDIRATRLDIG